jgi:hypothetical protein
MVNLKLLSILAIVLVISSCTSPSVAVSVTGNGKAALTPLADSFNPFATPTPTPTATPVPTPTPTPKPEPTVWPSLDLSCITSAAASTVKVQVSGTLSYNKTGIPNAPMYIGYSADGGSHWENFTLVQTRSDGTYGAVWIPNATGNYIMTVHWDGNDTLHRIEAKVNLALTSDSSGNEFSIMSNSNITNLAYNAATQVISFNTNGTSDPESYIYACVPKTLVNDVQALKVYVDGNPVQFASESQPDVWVISALYSKTEHSLTVQIPSVEVINPTSIPWTAIVIVAAVIVIALLAVVVVFRRRRRMAKTVASILKENRPTY